VTDSLFDYAADESTATFTDRSFPGKAVTAADLPNRDAAAAVCASMGVTDPRLLEECTLDVALTGMSSFATSAAATQTAVDAGPLSDGGVRSGTLAPGETASYTLALDGATKFAIADVSGQVEFKVTGEVTSPLLPGDHQFGVAPGDHHLQVTGTGDYHFRLVTLKPRTLTARVGEPVTGRVDRPGRVDIYRVDPAGADRLRITGTLARTCTTGSSRRPTSPGSSRRTNCVGTFPHHIWRSASTSSSCGASRPRHPTTASQRRRVDARQPPRVDAMLDRVGIGHRDHQEPRVSPGRNHHHNQHRCERKQPPRTP